jgi:hypothetical protein
MEVHHHAHTSRKKWTHYFWEFLMLFLAVFCGFLAENKREHMVEHRRVKESMKGIVENLKYDTIRCSVNAISNVEISKGLDSLRNELKKAIKGEINDNLLYYLILRYFGNMGQAVFNTSAITELKNSGSLRLVDNKTIVVNMADYYERKIFAAKEMMPTKQQLSDLQGTINQIFSLLPLDNYVASFDRITPKNYENEFNYGEVRYYEPALKLLSTDPKQLEKLYTELTEYEMQLKRYNFWLHYAKEAAEKLITEIKEEYHLE